jgi:hypothetical protein
MNSSLQIACFAGTLAVLAGSATGKTGRETFPEQTLSIRVYDKAGVSATILEEASNQAARLFRAAGIRICWEHPSTESAQDLGTDMTAAAFEQPNNRPYLVIRLMRRTPPTIAPGALGYSLPFSHRGAHVVIFYDRVEALTRSLNTSASVVLGHTMAHELGHVLLGSSQHTRGGLMQACWTPATWHLASLGLVVFDRAEIKRMRAVLPGFEVVDQVPPPVLTSFDRVSSSE